MGSRADLRPDNVRFDHHDPGLDGETLWETYAQLRAHCPVAHSEAHGGFWVLSRYHDVETAARDWEGYSSAAGHLIPTAPGQARIPPIDHDPPEHREYRKVFARVLGRAEVSAASDILREIIDQLVGALHAAGGGDFVSRVALPLPLEMLVRMLGFSAGVIEQVRPLAERMWDSLGHEAVPTALRQLLDLLLEEARDRRARPREDLITVIVQARIGDRPISDEEIALTLSSLVVAGHETTLNAATTLVASLAADPRLQERLRAEPDLIDRAVEESLRLWTPAQLFARTLTRDMTLHGETLRAGDRVMLLYGSADRDPEVFDNPHSFDVDRLPHRHLAFGWGPHMCVGAHLARTELRMLAARMVACGPFSLAAQPPSPRLEGGHHLGLNRLLLRFES